MCRACGLIIKPPRRVPSTLMISIAPSWSGSLRSRHARWCRGMVTGIGRNGPLSTTCFRASPRLMIMLTTGHCLSAPLRMVGARRVPCSRALPCCPTFRAWVSTRFTCCRSRRWDRMARKGRWDHPMPSAIPTCWTRIWQSRRWGYPPTRSSPGLSRRRTGWVCAW